MIDRLSNYLLDNMLIKDEEISEEKREVLLFGLTRILEDIPKYIGIFIICYLLNILPQAGLVLLVTILYKTFVGGAHTRTNIQCFIFSTVYFVGIVLIAQNVVLPQNILNLIYAAVFILSVYVVLKIAPADTEEIPIINKKLRKKLKIFGFLSLCLLYVMVFKYISDAQYKNIVIFTIALIDVMATKAVYRFFDCKYGYESADCKDLT